MTEGIIQKASKTADGAYKPSVHLVGDDHTYWLAWLEGIEGLHTALSDKVSAESGKNKLVYLNYGYFKIKPEFVLKTYQNTSDPMPKKDRNGNLSGVYEVMDVQSKREAVLWMFTQPNNNALWERLHQQIEYVINQLRHIGMNHVDADGYLPVILKIGKIPSRFGAKYAKVVAFDGEIDLDDFDKLDHPLGKETYYNYPPRLSNEYETPDGPTFAES